MAMLKLQATKPEITEKMDSESKAFFSAMPEGWQEIGQFPDLKAAREMAERIQCGKARVLDECGKLLFFTLGDDTTQKAPLSEEELKERIKGETPLSQLLKLLSK